MQLLVKDVQLVEASIVRLRLRGPAAEEPAQWRRAVAPGVEVGEITIHGLALSRLKHGFELRCDGPAATRFTPPGLRRRFGRRSSPSNPWQNPPGFRTSDQARGGYPEFPNFSKYPSATDRGSLAHKCWASAMGMRSRRNSAVRSSTSSRTGTSPAVGIRPPTTYLP